MTCEISKAADRLADATNAFSGPFAEELRGYVACLRDEAAKVPELAAWREAMLSALGTGLDYTPTADEAPNRLKGIITDAATAEQRAVDAEAERDAERATHAAFQDAVEAKVATIEAQCQEAFAQRDEARNLAAQSASDHAQALDRVESLVKERDVARRNADDLLTARDTALRERNDARERVAMLGGRVEELEAALSEVNAEARSINEMHDAAEARVKELTAALHVSQQEASTREDERDDALGRLAGAEQSEREQKARVKELTEELGAVNQRRLEDTELLSDVLGALPGETLPETARRVAALSSQPPPAPAQGMDLLADVLGTLAELGFDLKPRESNAIRATFARHAPTPTPAQESDPLRDLNACARAIVAAHQDLKDHHHVQGLRMQEWRALASLRSLPTQPALVEAVGPIVDKLRAVALLDEDYGDGETHGHALWWGGPDDGYDGVASVAQVRALIAAYEDVVNEAAPATAGLVEAVGVFLAFLDKHKNGKVNQRRWWTARDALRAAYDAVKGGRVEHPTPDHAQSVVTQLESLLVDVGEGETGRRDVVGRVRLLLEETAKFRAAVGRVDAAVDRMPSIAVRQVRDVLLWMLGLDGTPMPETLDKARVVEVLRKWLPPTHAAFDDLGLTLDAPAGGGK